MSSHRSRSPLKSLTSKLSPERLKNKHPLTLVLGIVMALVVMNVASQQSRMADSHGKAQALAIVSWVALVVLVLLVIGLVLHFLK